VSEFRAEVPGPLAALIARMMAKERDQRCPDLATVIRELTPWTQQPIPLPTERELPRLSLAVVNSSTTEFELSLAPAAEPFFAKPQTPSAADLAAAPSPSFPWVAVAITAAVTAGSLVALWWMLVRTES